MSQLSSFCTLAGGLGLFLVGLWLAADGLKFAGGSGLKRLVERKTGTREGAFVTGFTLAMLVPSTGALTMATIGFVNCGLVTLANALWLVAGCGFGGVITAWAVLGSGYVPALQVVALATLATGVFLRWTGPQTTRGWIGQAIAGAGLFLLGLHLASVSFAELEYVDRLAVGPASRMLICVVVGASISALLRSSSAAVAFVVLATAVDALRLSSAGALVLGADLGASLVAASVLMNGTPNAKRVAAGHAFLHFITFAIGSALLLSILPVSDRLPGILAKPAFLIVTLHTVSTVAATVILWRVDLRITLYLQNLWVAEEGDTHRARSLDVSVLAFPDLALEGLHREVHALRGVVGGLARTVFVGERLTDFRLQRDQNMVAGSAKAIDDFARRLNRIPLPHRVAAGVQDIPRASRAFQEIFETTLGLAKRPLDVNHTMDGQLKMRIEQLQLGVLHLVETSDPSQSTCSSAECHGQAQAIEAHTRAIEMRILGDCAQGKMLAPEAKLLLARLADLSRIARGAIEAATSLGLEPAAVTPQRMPPVSRPPFDPEGAPVGEAVLG